MGSYRRKLQHLVKFHQKILNSAYFQVLIVYSSAESQPLVNGLPEGKTRNSLQRRHFIITFAQDHKNKHISVSEKPRTAGGESSVNRFPPNQLCLYLFANYTEPYQSIKPILPPILFLFKKYWNSLRVSQLIRSLLYINQKPP